MLPAANHLSLSSYVVELTFAEMMTTPASRNPLGPRLGAQLGLTCLTPRPVLEY
jgi:hypothetical protein